MEKPVERKYAYNACEIEPLAIVVGCSADDSADHLASEAEREDLLSWFENDRYPG